MDIVLINAPIILNNTEGDERSYYPLNLLYLASSLEKAGYSVSVMDVSAEKLTMPQIKAQMAILAPKIIGISSMTPGLQSTLILAQELRPYAQYIGLGGIHQTVDPAFIDRHPYFDFGIVGEAEKTLVDIVSDFKQNKPIKKLWYGEPVQDLDTLPFPARHLINPAIYKRKEQMKFEVPAAGMLGSRGCPFSCIFCSIPARGKAVRFRSVKNVVDEMESIYDQCQGNYSFVDDCFTVNPKRTTEFCEELISRKIKCNWIASTRADVINRELGKLLKRAGCRELYFGVESGNERIRNKVIGKNLSLSKIEEAVAICRDNKIISNLFLMVGFPTETKKEMMDTVRIGNQVKADNIGIHITMSFPGSGIYKHALEHGMIAPDMIDNFATGRLGKGFRNVYPMFVPRGTSLKELVEVKKRAYRSFYLSPKWFFRRLKIWLTLPNKLKDDLKLIKLVYQVLIQGGTKGQLS